jgi:hypothetical protein
MYEYFTEKLFNYLLICVYVTGNVIICEKVTW